MQHLFTIKMYTKYGSSSYTKVIGSRPLSRHQKGRKCLLMHCSTFVGNFHRCSPYSAAP